MFLNHKVSFIGTYTPLHPSPTHIFVHNLFRIATSHHSEVGNKFSGRFKGMYVKKLCFHNYLYKIQEACFLPFYLLCFLLYILDNLFYQTVLRQPRNSLLLPNKTVIKMVTETSSSHPKSQVRI